MTSKEKDVWRARNKVLWEMTKKNKIIEQDNKCAFCQRSLVMKSGKPVKGLTLHHLDVGREVDYTNLKRTVVVHRSCHTNLHRIGLTDITGLEKLNIMIQYLKENYIDQTY